ncbi:MAG TPA: alpha-amylase family protein [Phycisphaerae bacterium]|nr:alpha-amylase family protein [Phycisphaerae bacterium]
MRAFLFASPCLRGSIAFFLSLCLLPAMLSAAEVRGRVVSLPAGIKTDQAVDLPPADYWRANGKVTDEGLTDNKKDFPHVLNLIEYRMDAAEGGQFELRAKYVVREPSLAQLRVNGEEIGMLFEKPGDFTGEWTSLGRFGLHKGINFIRFTSRHVDTPFPLVKAMRLVRQDGPVPPPEPDPKVMYPRPDRPKDWYRTVSRKIHGDFHNAGFIQGIGKNFNVDEYGRTLAEAGINSIVVFGKCRHGYTYYNTKVGTRHPGLDFDLLAGQIEACHKRNIAIWAYVCVGEEELFTSTLEQQVANPNERSIKIKPELGGAYAKHDLLPMIRELICNYDLDGLYIDFPETEEFIQEVEKLAKSLRPGMVVAYNHQWSKLRPDLSKLDILELESWDHKMAFYHWQYFARYARGSVPLTAMAIRFWKVWGDFGGLADEAMLRFQVATGQANGCLITIGDHLHPFGRPDPAIYDRIGRVMREARTVEPFVIDSESVPYVALHRPSEVKLLNADEDCRALLDAAVHFTILDPTQDLSPFKALVIPDAAKVTADEVARLRPFVEAGGRLLLMGKLSDELAEMAGVRLQDRPEPGYIRIDPRVLPSPPAMDIYTYYDAFAAEPLEGTKVLAPLVWQLQHGTGFQSRRQSPPDDKVSGFAAITWCSRGKGQVVYCGAPLTRVYGTWGYTAMRQILKDLLDYMIPLGERLVDVKANVPLEVSLNRQGERLIVHLVHCPQSRLAASSWNKDDYVHRQPVVDGMPAVVGAQVSLPAGMVRERPVRVYPANYETTVLEMGGRSFITVPGFSIRTVLVIE